MNYHKLMRSKAAAILALGIGFLSVCAVHAVEPAAPEQARKPGEAIPTDNARAVEPKKPWGWPRAAMENAKKDAADHKLLAASGQAVLDAISSDEELMLAVAGAAEKGDPKALLRNPKLTKCWGDGCIPEWVFGRIGNAGGPQAITIPVTLTLKLRRVTITIQFDIRAP